MCHKLLVNKAPLSSFINITIIRHCISRPLCTSTCNYNYYYSYILLCTIQVYQGYIMIILNTKCHHIFPPERFVERQCTLHTLSAQVEDYFLFSIHILEAQTHSFFFVWPKWELDKFGNFFFFFSLYFCEFRIQTAGVIQFGPSSLCALSWN